MADFLKGFFGSRSEEAEAISKVSSVPPQQEAPPSTPPAIEPAADPVVGVEDGPPDFEVVLRRAGVTAEQGSRVKKAQDLLKALPVGTTPALKRQIVEAAFQAFDIPTVEITLAASVSIEAVESFVAAGEAVQRRAVDEGSARIDEFERRIAEVRAEIDRAVAAQKARAAAARDEIARIEPILSFFRSEMEAAEPVPPEPPPPPEASATEPVPIEAMAADEPDPADPDADPDDAFEEFGDFEVERTQPPPPVASAVEDLSKSAAGGIALQR
jgi:hypothetical protein